MSLQIITINNIISLEHQAVSASHKWQDWAVLVTTGTHHLSLYVLSSSPTSLYSTRVIFEEIDIPATTGRNKPSFHWGISEDTLKFG